MSTLELMHGAGKAGRPTKADQPKTVDYVCGLRKIGTNRYSLVTGVVANGVPELKVDAIVQSLDLAAEELRATFQKLMKEIP